MTELGGIGPPGQHFVSGAVVTDGDWHRLCVVLDGSHKRLYVDGVTVAEDAQAGSGITASGVNIGVGKDYSPGTYWSGMIDDIRIYNVALSTEQIAALSQ